MQVRIEGPATFLETKKIIWNWSTVWGINEQLTEQSPSK